MIWRYLINHHLVGFQILSVYECDRAKDFLGCVPLRWSGSGSVIRDHSDHGTSNEPMNPHWTRIHRFIWFTMIRVISDLWSLSGSSQGNALLVFLYGLVGPLTEVNILFWSTVSKDERKRNYYRQVLSWIQGKSTKKIGRKRSDFRGPLHTLIVECCCH